MTMTYWHKQLKDQPLFPDMHWSRPENRNSAGKLLIIGGNQFGFAAPAQAYILSEQAGVGLTRVLLPQSVKKLAGNLLPNLEYATATPSGSFALAALGEFLEQADWADGVLVAGDLGRNSETAILLESFLLKYSGQITLTKDAADYCLAIPDLVLKRPNTLLVVTMAQLQKLATSVKYEVAFTLGMDLLRLVDGLHAFTVRYPAKIVIKHLDQILVATEGRVSTTKLSTDIKMWRTEAASVGAVWWLQNPAKSFEALTIAAAILN